MAASSETQRLIETTLDRLRREAGALSDLNRAAWETQQASLAVDRLGRIAGGLPASVALDVSGLDPSSVFEPARARILLNLLILAAASLPSGGIVRLAGEADDVFLRMEGAGAAWPAGMGACLVDEAAAQQAAADAAADGAETTGYRRLMALVALLGHDAGVQLSFLLLARGPSEPPMLRLGG